MWYEKLQNFSWMDALLVIGGMMVIAGLGISIQENLSEKNKVILIKAKVTDVPEVYKEVVFDISGEVVNPGVYKLKMGSRINEALIAAGGLGVNADRKWISQNLNRAEIIRDGQKIVIPKVNDNTVNNDKAPPILGTMNKLVSLNNASTEELDRLPGIGPSLAGRIIDYRNKQGGFKNIEELKLVSGIGDKLFEGIRDLISL